jgi:hypothetical protein
MEGRVRSRWMIGALALSTSLSQVAGATPRPSRADADRSDRFELAASTRQPFRAGQSGGGFGGPREDAAITGQFDANKDGRLDTAERRRARQYAESMGLTRGGRGGRGVTTTPSPGAHVTPESVQPYPATPFFDPGTVRTLFLEFEGEDWERELMAFKATDVEVPAQLVVDGRTYRDVGVQFRGNSSFSAVPPGLKHSISINVDWIDDKQDVQGHNNLTLLNAHEDPSFLRTVLYLHIARAYIPAPRANFVRVVINGENWGIYVNQQHFNKALLEDAFDTGDGTRWKVPGSPGRSAGGLSYLGDDEGAYRRAFEIKSGDRPEAWRALMNLTRVLEQTPPDRLEAALAPLLDIDGTLKFLALDNALVNGDGYWTRGSDYSLYLHPDGRFRLLPYDVNSTFQAGGGGGRGGRGGSPELSPFHAANDPSKPLLSRLLAVPALRTRYLAHVHDIATTWLDWNRLGPLVAQYQQLIAPYVEADTKKLYSFEQFTQSVRSLQSFADRRRAVLLTAGDVRPAP